MNLYRCFTPRVGTRREAYLGHWYAENAEAARKLARDFEERSGTPYKRPIEVRPAVAWEKAFNSENKGGPPKPFR